MRRRTFRLIALTTLVLAAGCARCAKKERVNAEEFVAGDAAAMLSVPEVGAFADHANALKESARGGPGGEQLVKLSANLASQLGFDPLTRDGLKKAGIDASRSMAVSSSAGTEFAAVPFDDESTLEATVVRLGGARSGATVRETRDVAGARVAVLVKQAGGTPELAWLSHRGFLLLARGPAALEAVSGAAQRKPEQSMAQLPAWKAARERIGQRDAYVFLPRTPGPALGTPGTAPAGGVSLGLALGAKELSLRSFVALAPEALQMVTAALPGGGEDQLAKLPGGLPFYVRGGVDVAAVVREATKREPKLVEQMERLRVLARDNGLDLDAEILENLKPSFALGIGLAPGADVENAFNFDPRRGNPLRSYAMLALGQVRDAKKAAETLGKLPALAEKGGLQIAPRQVGGLSLWTATYAQGEGLTWGLDGDTLVLAGGWGEQLGAALAEMKEKKNRLSPDAFPPRLRHSMFAKPGLALAIDFGQLNQQVQKLPAEAFPPGPAGMMARSAINSIVQPLSTLRGVMAVQPVEGGVAVDVSAGLQ